MIHLHVLGAGLDSRSWDMEGCATSRKRCNVSRHRQIGVLDELIRVGTIIRRNRDAALPGKE